MATSFGITYDYRCPFARNAHEHVVAGLRAGAPWEVEFVPFSLTQSHVEEGGTPVWDDPTKTSHLLAIEAGLVVRDRFPDQFFDVHLGLFAARLDESRDLGNESVVRDVLSANGVDADEVLAEVAGEGPRRIFRKAHEEAETVHHVFGVPTFIVGPKAVFVRIMTRPEGDAVRARTVIDHVIELIDGHDELNEFKHTTIGR
jgi:predicted DsbA family dithiol-disulfide isomerase